MFPLRNDSLISPPSALNLRQWPIGKKECPIGNYTPDFSLPGVNLVRFSVSLRNVFDLLAVEKIGYHIVACGRNDRASQEIVFRAFYGEAMGICERYSSTYDDALEILNEGFLKLFKRIHRFSLRKVNPVDALRESLRHVFIEACILHFKRNYAQGSTQNVGRFMYHAQGANEHEANLVANRRMIQSIRNLPPLQRVILNLFLIDGFDHESIAETLNISVAASILNLSNARRQLQAMLSDQEEFPGEGPGDVNEEKYAL